MTVKKELSQGLVDSVKTVTEFVEFVELQSWAV
jgi:hypothetical protein